MPIASLLAGVSLVGAIVLLAIGNLIRRSSARQAGCTACEFPSTPPSPIEDTMAAISDKPFSSTLPGQSSGDTSPTRKDMPFPQSTASATSTGQPAHGDSFERVVQGAHHTLDRLVETAAPHVQRLQEGVAAAGETMQSRAHQVREIGDEWADSLRNTVRENPLAAVVTALAVGVLIARLTR